jgi:hypothetical protein
MSRQAEDDNAGEIEQIEDWEPLDPAGNHHQRHTSKPAKGTQKPETVDDWLPVKGLKH